MESMKKQRIFKRKRESSNKRFNPRKDRDKMYDSTWSIYARIFLNVNKNCYACGKHASVVDHLVPHKGDEALFKKVDNHIPLCKKHHDTITALFDRHDIPKYKEKLEYLAKIRLETGTTSVVRVLPRYGERK